MKQYILGIEATLEIFGGKWKALITYILTFVTKRTGELQRLIPGISQKVLIEKLKDIEVTVITNGTMHINELLKNNIKRF